VPKFQVQCMPNVAKPYCLPGVITLLTLLCQLIRTTIQTPVATSVADCGCVTVAVLNCSAEVWPLPPAGTDKALLLDHTGKHQVILHSALALLPALCYSQGPAQQLAAPASLKNCSACITAATGCPFICLSCFLPILSPLCMLALFAGLPPQHARFSACIHAYTH
jgi:hypothetical protein